MLALAVLVAAVPAAQANVFKAGSASGSLSFAAVRDGEASVSIGFVAAGAVVSGPRSLQRSIGCVDGALLQRCVRITVSGSGVRARVLRPIRVMHAQAGTFGIRITGASAIRSVFISGCGTVRLDGAGSFAADGAQRLSYTPSDPPVVLHLKP